jgi:hypothetical protein
MEYTKSVKYNLQWIYVGVENIAWIEPHRLLQDNESHKYKCSNLTYLKTLLSNH